MTDKGTIPELVLLGDEPVSQWGDDKLNMGTYAEIIAGAALHTAGPFTIGVFGKWGEGKTSLLKLAKSLLDNAPSKPITVWFNAWQYDQETHPLVPLALAIADAVDVEAPEPDKRGKLAQWMVTRREMAAALRTLVAGLTLSTPPLSFAGKDSLAEFDKLTSGDAASSFGPSVYQRAFALLEQASARPGVARDVSRSPIVAFIDDLDRCTPDCALKLLQSIRLVLGQPGFMFVIALDREPIVQHLIDVYEKLKVHEPDAAGQAYLDKIVQLPLWIPSHQSAFPDYVSHLLETDAVTANERVRELLKGLAELLEVGTDANPRALVRLINNLIVDNVLWADRRDIADWLGLCAVSRLLREKLGSGPYLSLVRNPRLCEELAGKRVSESGDWRSKGTLTRAERSPDDELRFSVFRLRERTPAIRALLETAIGVRWLTEHETRSEIDRFLVSERREASEDATDGRATIDRAVRASLSLEDDEPITQAHRRTVETLYLRFSGVTDKDLAYLDTMTSLSTLLLYDAPVTDAGLEHLKGHVPLFDLELSGTAITDAGLEHLKVLTSLSSLYLHDTAVTDVGLEHLKELHLLSELGLSGTRITDAGLEHLKGLTSLSLLAMSQTSITDAGLGHLKGLTSLSLLAMSQTSITDAGLEYLKGLTSLTWLDLSETSITDAGLEHLKGLTSLTQLVLSETSISDAGKDNLRAALPNLTIRG